MKKQMMKFRVLFVLVLMLQLVGFPLQSLANNSDTQAPTWTTPVNYLALGDSLTAGVKPESPLALGLSFTDYIALTLKPASLLNSYNKGFSYPGYTTNNILEDLKNNVTKNIFETELEEETAQLHKSISEANIITLSVGANDVLPYIVVNAATGELTYDLASVSSGLQQVGLNYNKILTEIYAINPNVKVYVMGYFNPYPSLVKYQPEIMLLLQQLNTAIQQGMTGTTATFIPTFEAIAADYSVNVPNPSNIHLSEAGYKVVAELFGKQLVTDQPWISKDKLTAEVTNHTTATLNWKPAADNTAVTGYVIYNGQEKVGQVAGNVYTYDVNNLEENKPYTFTVVALDEATNMSVQNPTVTITTGTLPALFSDIENNEFKSFIEQAVAAGMVKGYPDGTFKPSNKLTRSQAAAIIVRALDLKATKAATFDDIKNLPAETQGEIAAAFQYGIVKGSNGEFKPYDLVTRAQLALMLKRSYELVTMQPYVATELAPFTDIANLDSETKTAISMLYTFKIADGSNGKYMPNDPTTRGQAAKMFVNSFSLLK